MDESHRARYWSCDWSGEGPHETSTPSPQIFSWQQIHQFSQVFQRLIERLFYIYPLHFPNRNVVNVHNVAEVSLELPPPECPCQVWEWGSIRMEPRVFCM